MKENKCTRLPEQRLYFEHAYNKYHRRGGSNSGAKEITQSGPKIYFKEKTIGNNGIGQN
jgi:hypothetical protein